MSHNENSGRERAPRGANCRGDRGARASAGARGADAARSVLGKVGSGARKVGSQARKAGSAVAPHFRRASKADVRAQAEERDAARGQGRPGGRPHGPRAPRDARNAAAQNARGPQRGYGEDEQRFSSAGAYGRDASAAPGGRNVALAGGAGRSSARSGFTAVDGGRSDAYDYGSAYRDDYAAGRDAYGYGAGRSGYGSEQGAYRAGANGYGRDEHAGGYDDVYGHGGYDSGYGPDYDDGYSYGSDRSGARRGGYRAAGSEGPYDAYDPYDDGGYDRDDAYDSGYGSYAAGEPDRIVPDEPRRPHRYVRPDLGPVPGSPSRRPGGAAAARRRRNNHRLILARHQRRSFVPWALAGVVVVLAVVLGVNFVNGRMEAQRQAEEAAAAEAAAQEEAREQRRMIESFSIANADLDSIPAAQTDPELFSLSGADAPELTDNELKALSTALAPVSELGEAGYVLINLETGFGLAYNADERIYGASSFKFPYAVYLCQDLVDGGELALDDECPESASGLSVSELIRASVVDSDNDSFVALRDAYDAEDFDTWIEGLGVTDARYDQESFPTLSTRSLVKLWANAYQYFQTGGDTATWLKGLCGKTTTSFLRDGITQPGITVYDKAGWYPSEDEAYCSVTDAGIVEDADGTPYLMAVMTSMSYSDEAVEAFEGLANIIFSTRGALAVDATEE